MSERIHKLNEFLIQLENKIVFLGHCGMEAGLSFKNNNPPLVYCSLWGILTILLFHLNSDYQLFKLLKIESLYPTHWLVAWIYWSLLITSGFWVWSLILISRRRVLSRKLEKVFEVSGLKNKIGELPKLVSDFPIDIQTRKLVTTNNSLPVDSYRNAKKTIQAGMKVNIDQINENLEKGLVEFIYSHKPLPRRILMPSINSFGQSEALIGQTHSKQIKSNFREVPHLLVAGQTGGGKSTFLRQLITTLIVKNNHRNITLVDLKGGLEFQLFENIPGVRVVPSLPETIGALCSIEKKFEERLELFKSSKCKDIEEFNKKNSQKENAPPPLERIYVVIDEAAELFMASSTNSPTDSQSAKRIVVKLAAQGRALGIHLIIATQRPDVKAVDSQVKANLTGIISFQMANTQSSMTVLNCGRAKDLPEIPGRAIWKSGFQMIEVQTPLLDVDQADKLLQPFRSPRKTSTKPQKPRKKAGDSNVVYK